MSFIPSLFQGDVLRIKLFLFIMLAVLISSCSEDRRSALVTDDGAEVYLEANDRLALIRVDDEDLEYLEKIGGNNPQETISSLFSLDAVYIEKDDYLKRKELSIYQFINKSTTNSFTLKLKLPANGNYVYTKTSTNSRVDSDAVTLSLNVTTASRSAGGTEIVSQASSNSFLFGNAAAAVLYYRYS